MFDRLARLAVRRPKLVLIATALLVVGALLYGMNVLSGLKQGGQTDPASGSARGAEVLDTQFGAGHPNLVLLVRADRPVDDPAVAAAATRLAARLAAEPEVAGVSSYWQVKAPPLRSDDGRTALIVARLAGDQNKAAAAVDRIAPQYRGTQGSLRVQIGGEAAVRSELTKTVRGDISTAEAIGIPLVALILILVLRSFFAALLPLIVGFFSVLGTNAALKLLSEFTDVSIFALNLATGLSLGLAADYGLFIVKRFREERRRGLDVETAMRITMNTAGRTVLYSSLTVAVAVSSMLVFPMYFLRSFAYAGVSVVLLAALGALVALPSALVLLGRGLDRWDFTRAFVWVGRRFRRRRPAFAAAAETTDSWWRRAALVVMRRPLFFTASSAFVLLLLGTPFLHLNIGLPDDRTLPATAEPHVVQQTLRDGFSSVATNEVDVVISGGNPAARATDIADYAAELSTVAGVVAVDSIAGRHVNGAATPPNPLSKRFASANSTYLAVSTDIEGVSTDGQNLVKRIRAVPSPFHAQVTGTSAELLDARTGLLDRMPLALAIIVATTLIVLFLLTGGVLIAVNAVVMNFLSLSATFGALVWIFQDGHLAGLLGFQVTGWVDVSLLVLLFCVAFGVSMDYEVFLLSRMKEEYVRTRDNHTAIAYGIEKTGGIVTAAALITSIVFLAMVTAHVTHIKMFGLGLGLAMLLDATLVRTVLVPALMRLAGAANWWAPRPLRAIYDRFGLKEEDTGSGPAPMPTVPRQQVAIPTRR
ncbi:MAG: putative drug exporter of the superfamily [Micromonosporaceae bacterium]|nr:putative drug exporter of the superfamily [Micromonosporaceae bacterium]